MSTRVTMDRAGLAAFTKSAGVDRLLAKVGEQIVADAKANAPRSGRANSMADSIDYEVVRDERGASVRVSWDSEHFYGLFHEVGTSKMSPRPFLRPALAKQRAV